MLRARWSLPRAPLDWRGGAILKLSQGESGPRDVINTLPLMMQWEQGDLAPDDELILFQELVRTGLAWRLQGAYGRHAARLIGAGLIEG